MAVSTRHLSLPEMVPGVVCRMHGPQGLVIYGDWDLRRWIPRLLARKIRSADVVSLACEIPVKDPRPVGPKPSLQTSEANDRQGLSVCDGLE